MLNFLSSAFDLLLVIIGFGLVIFIHELGHFLAAKWAGVRVHQFAVGFGSPVIAYRKGMGARFGSTEKAYEKLLKDDAAGRSKADASAISPTEYRLNWMPFGGYVKMLGQEDLDPDATSGSPDSYTQKPVWKRMVIISAGVVMNLILAAVLFIFVFMVGMDAPPPKVGDVAPDSPASRATLVRGEGTDGFQPGDEILRINGRAPKSFNDVSLAVVMASPDEALEVEVRRPGVESELVYSVTPRRSPITRMLEIGLAPATSNTVIRVPERDQEALEQLRDALVRIGLAGVEPGMTLISVDGEPVTTLTPLTRALERSGGEPVRAVFEHEQGHRTMVDVRPWPEFDEAQVELDSTGAIFRQPHLLGLTPAMRIGAAPDRAARYGLRFDDVFMQIGSVAWPDPARGIQEIRAHAREDLPVTVLRGGEYIDLLPRVDRSGRIGFAATTAEREHSIVTRIPNVTVPAESDGPPKPARFAAERLDLLPGARILSVDGRPVRNYFTLRHALRASTRAARAAGEGAEVELDVRLPIGSAPDSGPVETVRWSLTQEDVAALHELGWRSPVDPLLFEPEMTVLKANNPVHAMALGVSETRRMLVLTYLTFVRLFQGTVQVDQLKGPVGIAHLGTQIVDRGLIQLLFFLGLISVNLAVINFLPIPIADGGHFVMLLIEQMTGKPVSPAIQNITALIGLALILTVFAVVTYNDIAALLGG